MGEVQRRKICPATVPERGNRWKSNLTQTKKGVHVGRTKKRK